MAPSPPPHLDMWRPHESAVLGKLLSPTVKLLKVVIVGQPLPRHHPPQVGLENSTESNSNIFSKNIIVQIFYCFSLHVFEEVINAFICSLTHLFIDKSDSNAL